MRPAPLHGFVLLLAAACAPDPIAIAELPADEAQPLLTVMPAPPAPEARPAETGRPARFDLRFEDAGLPELARAISEITGKRFLLSGRLPPIRASLYSPDQVTAEEAYRAFLTILAENGLTVVPKGRFLAIVPSPGFANGR